MTRIGDAMQKFLRHADDRNTIGVGVGIGIDPEKIPAKSCIRIEKVLTALRWPGRSARGQSLPPRPHSSLRPQSSICNRQSAIPPSTLHQAPSTSHLPNTPIPRHADTPTHSPRSGQSLIFILLALVILIFVVLWNFDLHKTINVKLTTQNAGDAAATMGARWQGISLNLVGDLNIMNALAVSANDLQTQLAVSNLQARLGMVGPMIGFLAAQQAAKNNGVHQYDVFSTMIRDHAHVVRNEYTERVGPNGEMAVPEPYSGAWEEVADMLDLAADDGIAAGPENARFYSDFVGDHILLDPAFYDAIAGRSWCWFFHNAPGLLEDYTDFTWWPDLPPIVPGEFINSEIFGLGLVRRATGIGALVDQDLLASIASDRGLNGGLTAAGTNTTATWYCYGETWAPWLALSQDSEDPFPATGTVRPQYDYAGADSAVRVIANATRIAPGKENGTNTITWTAAAKPFGYLAETDPPHLYSIVLPAFHDIRLIPMDASSAWPGGSFDPEWRRFIEEDLPIYVASGDLAGCHSYYCNQLRTWEDEAFRADGVAWLNDNRDQCTAGGPGNGPGGGRRRGH